MKEADAKKLWTRLFGENDEAELKDLTNDQFEALVDLLENTNTPIEWEANFASRTIHIWKPTNLNLLLKEYAPFILLLAMSKSDMGRKLLEARGKNKNSGKNKKGTK